MVKAACQRIVGDPSLAEDIAQETFLLLIGRLPSLPARRDCQSRSSWLLSKPVLDADAALVPPRTVAGRLVVAELACVPAVRGGVCTADQDPLPVYFCQPLSVFL